MSARTAFLLLLLLPAAAYSAQRTFVSAGSGSDSNPCTRALPCRNFAAALPLTDPGGEIVALDSGGYGPVSIDKSVALVAPAGVHAAITAFSGTAIPINAGSGDVVILRGLYINGLGGEHGVRFLTGKNLHVELCVVSSFPTGIGIYGAAPGSSIYIKDTLTRQNSIGFYFFSSSTAVRAHLHRVRSQKNNYGFWVESNARATVTRGLAAGSSSVGFYALSAGAVLNVESSTAFNNAFGVYTFDGTVRVADSMITGNTTGVDAAGLGSTISFGNNGVHGNGTNGSFTSTVSQQ